MRYMKLLGLGMMVFVIGAALLFAQGNQEAANLTREGIEASKTKDWDKAIAAFKRAAQLDQHYGPNLASALQQRASVYVSQGKFQEAVTDYSEALKVKATDPDIFERRAYAEMQLMAKVKNDLAGMSQVEMEPKLAGRNITMTLSPLPANRRKRRFAPVAETVSPNGQDALVE